MGNERFWRIVITIRLLVYLLILLAVVIAIVFVANSIQSINNYYAKVNVFFIWAHNCIICSCDDY